MALTITHAKVSAITDNAAAASAGEVLPSDWNALHVVSGDAELIINTTPIVSGTTGHVLYDNAGTVGEAIVGPGLLLSSGNLSAPPNGSTPLPGDALVGAGLTLGGVHSTARRLIASYGGNLFKVRRVSDNSTLDVGIESDGWADVTSLNNFLSGTTGFVVTIYDQSGNGNTLTQSTAGDQGALNIRNSQLGRQIPVVTIASGHFYRKRTGTTSIPIGASPITVYMVVTNQVPGLSIGTYGDVESTVVDNGKGHMFSVVCGSSGAPHIGIDLEDGVFEYDAADQHSDFIFALAKTDGTSILTVKGGPATSPILNTISDGTLPVGYFPLTLEGGISLGEGGDGTPAPTEFVEGVIASGVSTDAVDQQIQNNLAYAFGDKGAFAVYTDRLETNEPVVTGGDLTVRSTNSLSQINISGAGASGQYSNFGLSDNGIYPASNLWSVSFRTNKSLLFFSYDGASFRNVLDMSQDGSSVAFCNQAALGWSSTTSALDPADTGMSRLAANSIAFGNGTPGDFSGTLSIGKLDISVNASPVRAISAAYNVTANNWFFGPSGNLTISGQGNLAVGQQALVAEASGSNNIGIGLFALVNANGSLNNIAIGSNAGAAITTGENNMILGVFAGSALQGGNSNMMIGQGAGSNITGSDNSCIGQNTAVTVVGGSQNIVIGSNCDVSSASANGQLSIGNYIYGTGLTGTSSTISAGKIGIGVKAPAVQLDVAGIIQTTGAGNANGSQLVLTGTGSIPPQLEFNDTTTFGHDWLQGPQASVTAPYFNIAYDNTARSGSGIGYMAANFTGNGMISTNALGGYAWTSHNNYAQAGSIDTGLSRLSAGAIVVGNGTQADVSGTLKATALYTAQTTAILHSAATITGGSTTNVPTLTGGPATGNPTKWLPYDDNGVTRYIPSW